MSTTPITNLKNSLIDTAKDRRKLAGMSGASLLLCAKSCQQLARTTEPGIYRDHLIANRDLYLALARTALRAAEGVVKLYEKEETRSIARAGVQKAAKLLKRRKAA